jgi:hypothetical protein
LDAATFATAISCIDGRVQDPVAAWMRKQFQVDFVDTITEPGADGVLAQGPSDVVASIREKVMVSTDAHQSRVVAVVGHHGCAGNPVPREDHLRQIGQGMMVVASWGLPVRVVGLWVNDQWQVELVATSAERDGGHPTDQIIVREGVEAG